MKIAVAALTSLTDSQVSSYPLRAPFILFFDESGGFLEAVDNPFRKAGGHKGYGMARLLSDNMVEMLIVRDIPPAMSRIMEEAGVRVMETEGDALRSISEYISPEPDLPRVDTTQA